MDADDALAPFHPAVAAWFQTRLGAPTEAQSGTWPRIRAGEHVLLSAPTGSGKTLAAFLVAIDGLLREGAPTRQGVRVLYISPLKALDNDVHRNLQVPLQGVAEEAARLGLPLRLPTAAVRTGDTSAAARQRQLRQPPDILITTPETVFLLLTSPRAQHLLATVETVIVDEIHALASNKRGTHLALSLERLERLCDRPPQRLGLSATQRPLERIAGFLGGRHPVAVVDCTRSEQRVATARREPPPPPTPERVATAQEAPPPPPTPERVATAQEAPPPPPTPERVATAQEAPPPPPTPERVATAQEAPPPPPTLDLTVSVPVADFRDLPGDSVWDSIAPLVLADVLAHRTTLIFVPNRGRAEFLTRQVNALAGEELCRAHHGSISTDVRQEVEAALKGGQLRALCATGTLELGIDVGAIDHVVMVGSPGSVARGLQRIGRAGHAVGQTSAGRMICRTPLEVAEAGVVSRDMCRGQIEQTRVPEGALDVLAQHLVSMAAVSEFTPAEALALARRAYPYRGLSEADLRSVLELVSGRYPAERFAGLRARVTWDLERGVVSGRPGSGRAAIMGAGTIPDRGLFPVFGPDGSRVGELDEEFVHESRRGDVFLLGTTSWRIAAITPDRVLATPGAGAMPRVPFWHGEGPGRPYEVGRALCAWLGEAEARLDDAAWWAETAKACRLESQASGVLQRLVREQAEAGCLPTDRRVAVEWYRDPLGDVRVAVHAAFGRGVTAPWSVALRALLQRQAHVTGDVVATDGGMLFRLAGTSGAAADAPPVDLLHRWSPRALEAALLEGLPRTALFAAHFRECAGRALLLARGDGRKRLPLWLQRLQASDLLAVARRYPDFPIVREALRECLEDHFDLPAWREVMEAIADRRMGVTVRERPGPSPFAAEMEFQFKASALYKPDTPRAEAGAADLASVQEEPQGPYLARAEAALAGRWWGQARSPEEVHDRFLRIGVLFRDEVPEQDLLAPLLASGRVLEVDGRLLAAEELPLWRAAVNGDADARTRWILRWAAARPSIAVQEVRQRFGWECPDLGAVGLACLADGRYAHAQVRQMVRRRALALARAEVAPVSRAVFAEFVRRRQIGSDLGPVIGMLQGVFLPLKVWLGQILPVKVAGFRTADLDTLVRRGEVLWVARGETVAFYLRADYAGLAPTPADAGDVLPVGAALWFSDLQAASGLDAEALDLRLREWASGGAVSNDSLEPLLAGPNPRRRAVGGRWWALPSAVPAAPVWADQLLERYGVVSREVWHLASPPMTWAVGAAALAEVGARRGYFVRGLGGLQFARSTDIDRLRETRPSGTALVATVDPACVWREAPRRPGSFVVLLDGRPALQVAGFGRKVKPLRELAGAALVRAVAALQAIPAPRGRVEVAVWDGSPVMDSAAVEALLTVGFARGPSSLRWRQG